MPCLIGLIVSLQTALMICITKTDIAILPRLNGWLENILMRVGMGLMVCVILLYGVPTTISAWVNRR
jgi:hypothetical protein